MAYGHAERNLALIRQLETDIKQLRDGLAQPGPVRDGLAQPDPEEAAWLQEVTGLRS